MHQASTVPAACPRCEQALAVPGYDLRSSIRCPRCRSVLILADIVSRNTALVPAITLTKPLDNAKTIKDINVVFADGTVPEADSNTGRGPGGSQAKPAETKTDDVDERPPASAVAAVLPGAVPYRKKHPFAQRLPLTALRPRVQPAPAIVRRAANLFFRIDHALRPRKLAWLLGAAAVGTVGQCLDLLLGTAPAFGLVSAATFLVFASTLALGHISAIREDDGTFAWSTLRRRARAFRRALEADAKHFSTSPALHKRTLFAKALVVFSLVSFMALESANLVRGLAAMFFGASESAHDVEAYVAAGAFLLAALGALALRMLARSTRALDSFFDPEDDVLPMFRARAAVLDRGDAARAVSRFEGRAKEVLGAVVAWSPRVGSSGREYATDLARHIRRHVGSVSVEANPILEHAQGVTSALVVGGSLLILVRRAAHLDPVRALRAIHRARAVWRGKPMLIAFAEHPQALVAHTLEPYEKLMGRMVDTIDGEPRVVGVWL